MSRFFSTEYQNISLETRPVGRWRRGMFRKLPYHTGDDLRLLVKVTVKGAPPVALVRFQTNDQAGGSIATIVHALKPDSSVEVPVNFLHIPYSGEYGVAAEFGNPPPRTRKWTPTEKRTIALFQVIEDYKLWAIGIIMVVGAIVGKGIDQLIRWLT